MKTGISFVMLLLTIVTSEYSIAQNLKKPMISLMVWDNRAIEGSDRAELQLFQTDAYKPDLVVHYDISGTARNGFDFRIGDSIRMINTKASLIIKPVDDLVLEGDETVTITLRKDTAYTIDPRNSTKTIIIQDNELPDVQFLLPCSGGKESDPGIVEVALSQASLADVRIDYKISGNLVQNPEADFRSSSGQIVIPAGSIKATIPLEIINDDLPEDDETIIIEIVNAVNANIGINEKHYYNIENDDGDVPRSSIFDRIYGILLGSRGGSSLGAVVEGMDRISEIEKIYGTFDEFIPYNHYDVYWSHPAGSTEDGIERQKAICTAIIEKQNRIKAEDLMKIWIRDYEIKDMYYMTQPYDKTLLAYAKWGCSPEELPSSKYGGMPDDLGNHIHLTARVFHAIPIINAGDPAGAIEDTKEIGRIFYEDLNDDAFAWGGVYNAALALAVLPGATVNSVIEDALKYATPDMRNEIEYGLSIAGRYSNPMDRGFREELNKMYEDPESPYRASKRITKYIGSSVYENVTCAFAIFKASNGNVELAVRIANNRGRDTDCTAASAGGLAGALTGTSTIPEEWIKYLEKGTRDNPYTNSHMPNKATAQALYRALQNKLKNMEEELKITEKQYEKQLPEGAAKVKNYLELMRKCDISF
jgi:ADP-ribosylglycohydrolase